MTANQVAFVASFVLVCGLLTWAAGYLLALEDVIGGQRHRYENWAYQSPDQVRSDDPRDLVATDLFWDRAQFWPLFRKRNTVVDAGEDPRVVAGADQPGLPGGASRWTYRGACTIGLNLPDGLRRVPHRDLRSGVLLYGVPLLDGQPLSKADRAATIVRAKIADLWGCPICSGMWGGLVAAFAAAHWGPWQFGWELVVVCQLGGWGLARRIGWGN
jgi:hypothetical protein